MMDEGRIPVVSRPGKSTETGHDVPEGGPWAELSS